MSAQSWQGKTVYFILTDRFQNGDPSNDDQGKGEFDPADDESFHGGDLKGVTRRLAWIKGMGFDAVWLTPPVHNQWINPYVPTKGYHGYWAYDFTAVDPHLGTMEDYKELVREAHRLGLKVIQDVVVNHTGNYFTVDEKGFDPEHPEKNWRELPESVPPEKGPKAPNDPVFRMNDPNVPEHRKAAVYNFTPNISDFKSREQTLTWNMGDLDDVNLRSPLAARRMKEIYRFWIDEADVDAYRVDTVYYTPEEFYEGWLYDKDPGSPGVKVHAAKKGKKDFLTVGECWTYDVAAINRYIRDGKTRRLDSAIDLPLNEALTSVFFRKAATEELRTALEAERVNRPLWFTFLDNHDVERINSRAGRAAVRQSMAALFSLPGIPVVYYGTEAGLRAPREDMFDERHFDRGSEHYRFLRDLIALRGAHPALSRGKVKVVRTSPACGVLSYSVSHGGETVLAVFNTSSDRMYYELGPAARGAEVLLTSKDEPLREGMLLEPEAYRILKLPKKRAKSGARPAVRMKPPKGTALKGRVRIGFETRGGLSALSLLSNDDYDARIAVSGPRGRALELDTAELGNGQHRLALLAETADGFSRSNECLVTVDNEYRLLRETGMPEQGKAGPGVKLHPPADPSYDRQMCIERVSLFTSGKDLRIRFRMTNVTNGWNPPNGYDHVYFSVYFDFPGRKGKRFFPKLDYGLGDFEFNAGFLLYGWGGISFGAEDSTEGSYGDPLIGEVSQAADLEAKTVAFTFSKKYFDGLKTLQGTKIFVSTWDGYLADLRGVSDRKEDWCFYTRSGEPAAGLPRVYDHLIIRL